MLVVSTSITIYAVLIWASDVGLQCLFYSKGIRRKYCFKNLKFLPSLVIWFIGFMLAFAEFKRIFLATNEEVQEAIELKKKRKKPESSESKSLELTTDSLKVKN